MKRLLLYLGTLLTVFIAVSFIATNLLEYGLKLQRKDSFGTLNHLTANSEAHDVIFLGSSLAKNNLDPAVFDSITGFNSYNFGFYAAKIDQNRMILERYLSSSHPAPKMVVLVLEENAVDTLYIKFPPQYYPYREDSIIYNYVAGYDKGIWVLHYAPFLGITQYNDYVKKLGIEGLFSSMKNVNNHKGFDPLTGIHKMTTTRFSDKNIRISEKGYSEMERICVLCRDQNIKLVFLVPPYYYTRKGAVHSGFADQLAALRDKYAIIIMDHTTWPQHVQKSLFYDKAHLNENGARLYTIAFSDSIRALK
ncbi:MAG TPA: hypothetical protein VL651_08290 [Bacteroidia bacterium]|jgi:hypothetical protein|nr:hypothetical protein [Bacteroidia bacterium]